MLRLLAIPLGLLLLLGAAMVWSGGGVERPADFTFVNRGDIKNLDPLRMTYLQDIRIGYALWEGLYTLDPQSLQPVPGAAERIDISDDGLVYTFHVRPGAGWSDGRPIEAGDFAFAWERMLREQGDYADLLHYIRGARDYQMACSKQQPADFRSVGVEVLGPRRLRVTLNNRTPFFPDICAFPPLFPLHRPCMFEVEPGTRREREKAQWVRPPNLVSNGPYRLASWEFKKRLRMVANEHYWNRSAVKSRVIDMAVMENEQAQLSSFKTGAVDWLADVTGQVGAELHRAGDPDLRVFTGFGTYFYSFNCLPKLPDGGVNPLADPRVRRALSLSVDKQFIVRNITRLGQPVATTYIPPGVFADYRSPAGLPMDVAAARRLLAEAGYTDGRGFPQLKVNFNTEGQHRDIAEYLQRQWKTNLAIDVVLDGKELKTFGDQLRNKQYAISRASWIGDYNDPSTFTDKYRPNSGNNDAGWTSAEFDRLCALADREPDRLKRLELFHRAESVLLEEAPIMPLYHYVNAYMLRPNVRGIPLNARNMVMFQAVEVAK